MTCLEDAQKNMIVRLWNSTPSPLPSTFAFFCSLIRPSSSPPLPLLCSLRVDPPLPRLQGRHSTLSPMSVCRGGNGRPFRWGEGNGAHPRASSSVAGKPCPRASTIPCRQTYVPLPLLMLSFSTLHPSTFTVGTHPSVENEEEGTPLAAAPLVSRRSRAR